MVSYEVHRGLNLRINCEINECKKEESIIRRFVPILEKSAVFLIWVLLVTTLFSGVIGSAAQNMDVVYDDQVAEQWIPGTWWCEPGIYNFNQSMVVNSGIHAIEVNNFTTACEPGKWPAFVLDRRIVSKSIQKPLILHQSRKQYRKHGESWYITGLRS